MSSQQPSKAPASAIALSLPRSVAIAKRAVTAVYETFSVWGRIPKFEMSFKKFSYKIVTVLPWSCQNHNMKYPVDNVKVKHKSHCGRSKEQLNLAMNEWGVVVAVASVVHEWAN